MSADLRDVLHTPYELGGRTVGVGLDCLGVVGEIARRRHLPVPDGWPTIRRAWELGELPTATGFPPGWVRMPAGVVLRDFDVLLFFGPSHPWCAIIDFDRVWSASAEIGSPYAIPLARWRTPPAEVWRYCP
jgi:hypothetical protein